MNIALIGYGYWGKNLLRNIIESSLFEKVIVIDTDNSKLQKAKKLFNQIEINTDINYVLKNNEIEAVIIATPPKTHYSITKLALNSNKNVLIEKPFCLNSNEGNELLKLAKEKGKLLMVDHTFLYTGAVQKIKSLIEKKEIGSIKYIDSVRINLGLFQNDVNVLWDLASHDISIINYILDEKPTQIQAIGQAHELKGIENIAYLTLKYESGIIVHCNCSWVSPIKIRQMIIGGDKKMILYNDIEPEDKIKVYDAGYQIKDKNEKERLLVEYRMGDYYTPKLENKEALAELIKDFHSSITNRSTPISSDKSAINVIKILQAAEESFANNSKLVIINWA